MKASTIQWHLGRDNQVKLARFCEKHAVRDDKQQAVYETGHREGESCEGASWTLMLDDAFDIEASTPDEAKAAINAYTTNKIIEELEQLEFVDWESYGDKPKEKYDDDINILIDPLIGNYVKKRVAELRKTS